MVGAEQPGDAVPLTGLGEVHPIPPRDVLLTLDHDTDLDHAAAPIPAMPPPMVGDAT
jgi:hypothetical protein